MVLGLDHLRAGTDHFVIETAVPVFLARYHLCPADISPEAQSAPLLRAQAFADPPGKTIARQGISAARYFRVLANWEYVSQVPPGFQLPQGQTVFELLQSLNDGTDVPLGGECAVDKVSAIRSSSSPRNRIPKTLSNIRPGRCHLLHLDPRGLVPRRRPSVGHLISLPAASILRIARGEYFTDGDRLRPPYSVPILPALADGLLLGDQRSLLQSLLDHSGKEFFADQESFSNATKLVL